MSCLTSVQSLKQFLTKHASNGAPKNYVFFHGFLRAPNRAFLWFSSCTKACFFLVFFVHQIVLFLSFLRAPNRAFLWFSSCTKSCFFVVFFVHQMVPQFMDFASYTKSCSSSSFFVVFFVHQIVLFSGFLRAPSRAFFWFSSCTKSCFFVCFLCAPNRAFFKLFFVHQIVLFSGFLRAPNRAFLTFLRFSSRTKWCPTSCHCYRG